MKEGSNREVREVYRRAARELDERFEEIFAGYRGRLQDSRNLLAVGGRSREIDLEEQAAALLKRAAAALRGDTAPALVVEEELYHTLEAAREPMLQHPDETFRAGQELCRAALAVIRREVDLSGLSAGEVFELSDRVQSSVLDCTARVAMLAYVDYLLAKVTEVQVEERQRFSRELHDRVAHSMALVNQNLELFGALRRTEPERAEENLSRAMQAAREAMDTTRGFSQELRRSDPGAGLEVALENLLRSSLPPGTGFEADFAGDESLLPDALRDELYLTLREGIRNAVVHSGTDSIRVEVRVSEEEVLASVEDRGLGFSQEPQTEGVGLHSMRERVALLRGTLDVSSAPERGTKISVRVPLNRRVPRNRETPETGAGG